MPLQPIIKTDDLTEKTDVSDNDYIIGVDLTEPDESKATFKAKAVNVRGKDTISIDTIADMKQREGSYDGQSAILNGFYLSGDRGGGRFYWDASYVHLASDIDGMIVYVTGVSVGAWIRMYDGEIYFDWCGAYSDNSTDNGTILQDVIDWAGSNGNLPVVLGIGSYRYSTVLIFNYQGIFKGQGQTKSRLIYDGSETNAFQPATQLGVYQDFGIYAGSGSHVNGWGTLETTTSNGNSGTTMRNIWVQGFSNGVGFRMVDVWNHDLYNCKAIACDIGWQLGNPSTLSVHNSISYNHCKANSCTTYGMYVKGVTSTNIINGDFSECGIGIYLETAYGLIIQSCYSEYCDTAALSVDNSQVRAVKIIGGIYGIQEAVYPIFNIGAVQEMSIENVYFVEGDVGIKIGHGSGASEVCLSQNYFYTDVIDQYDIGSNALMSIATPRGYLGERMGYSDFPQGWSQTIEPGTVAGIPKITTTKTGRLSSTFSVLKDEGSKTFLAATSDYIINFASGLVGFAIISAGSDYAIYNLNSGVTPIIESAGFSGGTYALQYSSIVDSGSYLLYNNSGVAVDFCWQFTLSQV